VSEALVVDPQFKLIPVLHDTQSVPSDSPREKKSLVVPEKNNKKVVIELLNIGNYLTWSHRR
jgi:hypothetical protein